MRLLMLMTVVLGAVLAMGAGESPAKSVVLEAVDDAYVVTDVSSQEDPQGLRAQNFGKLQFVRVWYASQLQAQERVVSIGLVQFDLKPLEGRDVKSATLQLYADRVDIAQSPRMVDVSLVQAAWAEADVTFTKRPAWSPEAISTGAVFGANVWYSWDVTQSVIQQTPKGTTSYVLGLRTIEQRGEEQAVFASKESGRNAPRLIVTYAPEAESTPAWVWIAAIAGGVVVAFGGGILITRRTRSPKKTTTA